TMTYDSVRQRLVLFDGETWECGGSSWVQRTPTTAPGSFASAAMAFDAGQQRALLFTGGMAFTGATWEWDGDDWHQRNPATSPVPRGGHSMAYDCARRRVVMFGGTISVLLGAMADTWEWTGNDWISPSPVVSPNARTGHAMAYDAARQRVVLFGGC